MTPTGHAAARGAESIRRIPLGTQFVLSASGERRSQHGALDSKAAVIVFTVRAVQDPQLNTVHAERALLTITSLWRTGKSPKT